jgi:membrane associated rhomboid family serine protease
MLSLAARPCFSSMARATGRSIASLRSPLSLPLSPPPHALAAWKRVPLKGGLRRNALSTPPDRTISLQRRAYGGFNGGGARGVFSSPEGVVYALMGANGVVYFLWATTQTQGQLARMATHFTTSARHLDHGLYHTLLTSVFSHKDFGHLFVNMFGLFFFGREISHLLGPRRFLGLYLASGIVSSWAAVQEQRQSRRVALNLGASGAVNSITALSILLFPHSTMLIFGIVPMPAWLGGTMFIGRDLYGWLNGQQDGIGHFAHLSGAACGGLYYAYLRRGVRKLR